MEQKDFFMALEDAFDETNIEDLTLETNFRELDEWGNFKLRFHKVCFDSKRHFQ